MLADFLFKKTFSDFVLIRRTLTRDRRIANVVEFPRGILFCCSCLSASKSKASKRPYIPTRKVRLNLRAVCHSSEQIMMSRHSAHLLVRPKITLTRCAPARSCLSRLHCRATHARVLPRQEQIAARLAA